MAWEHNPVIEKKKPRFLSLFLILMVKFPPLHVILIMRRYWSPWTLTWERRLLLKAGSASPTTFLNTYLRLSCSSFSFLWNLVKNSFLWFETDENIWSSSFLIKWTKCGMFNALKLYFFVWNIKEDNLGTNLHSDEE